ncbi:hypothetical protein BAOM_1732 [Peribacillus asahii]|uniref:Uncharacterized protein n=1 Tax=Peribacillus asahii TaxID=228899 RepID=A0A3Q9RM35_9BACI|nr:hypothetical protein BAOM_1732 [Peribacillus asahii]
MLINSVVSHIKNQQHYLTERKKYLIFTFLFSPLICALLFI